LVRAKKLLDLHWLRTPNLPKKIIQDIMRKRNPEPSESEDAAADAPGDSET